MSNTTVKLQIPLDKSLRDRVARHAHELGFSSVQDFTRVMYTTMINDNLRLGLSVKRNEYVSPKEAARLDKLAEEALRDHKTGKLTKFDSVDEFLNNLNA